MSFALASNKILENVWINGIIVSSITLSLCLEKLYVGAVKSGILEPELRFNFIAICVALDKWLSIPMPPSVFFFFHFQSEGDCIHLTGFLWRLTEMLTLKSLAWELML